MRIGRWAFWHAFRRAHDSGKYFLGTSEIACLFSCRLSPIPNPGISRQDSLLWAFVIMTWTPSQRSFGCDSPPPVAMTSSTKNRASGSVHVHKQTSHVFSLLWPWTMAIWHSTAAKFYSCKQNVDDKLLLESWVWTVCGAQCQSWSLSPSWISCHNTLAYMFFHWTQVRWPNTAWKNSGSWEKDFFNPSKAFWSPNGGTFRAKSAIICSCSMVDTVFTWRLLPTHLRWKEYLCIYIYIYVRKYIYIYSPKHTD